ncbi:MAG: GNAT family N-acetyltransferase [Desulfobacula sp.]|nr:GNAT family N-acetyltransferase [Desulfobacula sp.]
MEAREIQKDELDKLLEFYLLHLYDVKDEPMPDQSIVESIWSTIIESENLAALGVFDKGALMASCSIAVIPNLTRGCRPYAVIENIATHRQNRRSGYGRANLEFAADFARRLGCYKAMFMTGHLNEKIKKFCESVGFTSGVKNAYIKRWEY